MCIRIVFLLFALCFGLSGCSIKSDRSDCPGLLYIEISGGDEKRMYAELSDGEDHRTMHITKGSSGVAVAAFEVEKNEKYEARILSGVSTEWDGIIKLGAQMPPLYAYHSSVACGSEVKELKVSLEKQFARLHVEVIGLDCKVRVRGNVTGVDVKSLSPIPGLFCAEVLPTMDMKEGGLYFTIDIPRQIDDSLMLELMGSDNDLSPVYVYRLGDELKNMGVDWGIPSLEDVHVRIEYIDNKFELEVRNWEIIEL